MRPLPFVILVVVTLVTAAAAAVVLTLDRTRLATAEPGAPMFPALPGQAADIASIRIETPSGVATLHHGTDGWGLAEQGGYPIADGEAVRLIAALAALAQVEIKTADPARLGRLGLALDADESAAAADRGQRVTLADQDGEVLLDVVLGHGRPGLYGDRADGLYLRRGDETRSWLVRGTVAVPEEPLDWIDRSIADIDAGSVIRIALEPAAGAAVVAVREAEKQGLRVQTVPEGHRVADQRRVDAIAGALQVLDFSAARRVTDPPPDATPAGIATITTRDGLTLRLALLTAQNGVWAGVGAAADPIAGTTPADGEGAVVRAATISRRTEGWLYRLPAYPAELLTTTLERLIEPVPADGT